MTDPTPDLPRSTANPRRTTLARLADAAWCRALQAHETTCREREERREARAAEFRDEMRRALADLRTSLREVNLTIDRLHWRIVTTLLSTVAGLLGLSGWLATKLLNW